MRLVAMAIEVLETMSDECIVAGRSAKLLQKALERAAATRHQKDSERLAGTLMSMSSSGQQHGAATSQDHHHHPNHPHHPGRNVATAADAAAVLTTSAESDHGAAATAVAAAAAAAVGSAVGPWPDPTMGINWMHCWAPVNLLDNDMLDFDLNMPYMGFESGDHMGQRPG